MPELVKEEFSDRVLEKKLIKQIGEEYDLCWRFQKPRLDEWEVRLSIYNNQKRDKEAVGDPLLFHTHQDILSILYDDDLLATFGGRLEGDEEKARNYQALANYDKTLMNYPEFIYEWDWDATFFESGYLLLNDFDRQTKTPVAEVIDPMVFVRDPRAIGINGDAAGRGYARFFGREIYLTKRDMKENSSYFNIDKLKKGKDFVRGLTERNRENRRQALGYDALLGFEEAISENYEYPILQWFTHFNGKKYVLELGNDRTLLVRIIKLPWDDWPLIERKIFPISHSFSGVSLSDLLEDKQRAKATVINYALEIAKSEAVPQYLFDQNKIRNVNDLNFETNKFIRVDGSPTGAVEIMPRKQISNTTEWILNYLDQSAQIATATPSINQGQNPRTRRTKGENLLVSQRADLRNTLPMKIFGWSEKKLWEQHYRVYNYYFKEGIDKKMAKVAGPFGPTYPVFGRKDIIMKHPLGPEIEIESRVQSEAKKLREYQQEANYLGVALSLPDARKRYAVKNLGKKIYRQDELDRIFPKTIDELQAEDENKLLNKNTPVDVRLEQNHLDHLETHAKADDTPALRAHILATRMMIQAAKVKPELFPHMQEPVSPFQPGSPLTAPHPQVAPAGETIPR